MQCTFVRVGLRIRNRMDPHSIEFLDSDPPVHISDFESHIENFETVFINLFNLIFSSILMRRTLICSWLQINIFENAGSGCLKSVNIS
jgi:hypothetical protein